MISPIVILLMVVAYFGVLLLIARLTSTGGNEAFFVGERSAPWYLVAFGMIGASLSGVTFISVPGWVGSSGFSYMQMVLGYLIGYLVIGGVLMPLYYRMKLTSIYTYLNERFGNNSYKIGAFYFLLSRTIGAAFRLYLVAVVFQFAVFDRLGFDFPFWLTVAITILLIWIYTQNGGIKTIIYTDVLQTTFMLGAVIFAVIAIGNALGVGVIGIPGLIADSSYSQMFFFEDFTASNHFVKQLLSGAFIAIVMTGLDQDMMQKNLACKNIGDAQKNMFWFSIVLVFANLVFLSLGALLFIYIDQMGLEMPAKADELFPMIAIDHLGGVVAVLFVLGLIAAAYSSADSALTSLTTSFSVDFLDVQNRPENQQVKLRKRVHVGFSVLLFAVILIFETINNDSVIKDLFTAAGFTYGPLLGLFFFGILTKRVVQDKWVISICLAAPIICYLIKVNSEWLLGGYKFGFELLLLNGVLTFIGLSTISKSSKREPASDI